MSAIDVAPEADFGLRTETGGPPARATETTDGGEALWGAAFRQSNSVVSALQYMRNSGRYTPVPDYNPVKEIKGWGNDKYFLTHGQAFVGSQSPAETLAIKSQIDQEETDRKTLSSGGVIGFVAQMGAGLLDPTLLLPGGVGVDAVRGGLSFQKAAVELGKAGFMQTVAQEALLQATQRTRPFEESAINVASGTMLTALIGGSAAAYLGRAERAAIEAKLRDDRAAINAHAGNPGTGEMAVEIPANENAPAGTGQAMAAGAAAADTRQIELVPFGLSEIPGVRTVVEKTSPMQRGFGSESVSARRTFADLGETPLLMKQNLEGEATVFGGGPAVDREARLMIQQGQVAVGDEMSNLYSAYRFGEEKMAPRMQGAVRDALGQNPEGKMSYDEFKAAVTDAARSNDTHAIPQVQMAAQTIRNKVFEPWKKRAIDIGLFGPDVDVKTADSYVQRLYNKQAIAAKRPDFVNRVTDWLESDQTTKAQTQVRIEGLAKKVSDAETNIEFFTKQLSKTKEDDLLRAGFEEDLTRAMEIERVSRKQLEEEIANWQGKSVAEAKAALKARATAEEGRAPEAKRLKAADRAVEKAVKRILESDREMSRVELEGRANEITDRILSSSDGRLPYDLGMGHNTAHGGSGELARGALAAREFNIPDATIRDFLENDIEHIVATHLKTMVPDVLLTEKFGDVNMTEAFRKINDEYAALSKAAGSEKERVRLEKERQGVITDLAAQRDTIRGLYGIAPEGPLRNVARAVGVIKNYNVLTSMGSAALSSLPDMAGVVMRHGLVNTFNDAWVPFFNMLTRQSDVWQEAGRQFRAMGIATEMATASRHHALTDTLDTYHPQSRVERTMQWATGKFQFANMLAPWTDFAKVNASLVTSSEILRAVKAAAEGKATARQMRQLGESSIEPHMADRIHKAFEAGGEIRDGVHLPNTADWTDKQARRVFEGAVARDVDISVITPGLEKPLWMRDQVLGVMGQFKSFTAASTERILIANLQRRDAQVLQGLMFSMGLGMLSYKIGSLTGGQPTSDKPQDWIKEAISKGGILGWFEEANALASKATRGGVDVYRMIGADKPLTRYASRSAMDQILGPTAGKIGGILSVASAASKPSEWSESDSKALRRLVAGQNVFYLRGLFNQVEVAGNDAFGIEMKVKPQGH